MEILGGNWQCLRLRVCKGNFTSHVGFLTQMCYSHVHTTRSALGDGLAVVDFACLTLPGAWHFLSLAYCTHVGAGLGVWSENMPGQW